MLTSPTFWTDVFARAGRNAVQVLIPILAVAAVGGGISGVNLAAVGISVAVAFGVVVLRALTGLRAGPGAPAWVDGIDRAVAAAAASAVATVTAANFDALTTDWRGVAVASASAAALALVAMFTNTPTPVDEPA